MILLLIVGIYALVTKRVRVTRSFTLTGECARIFGIVLVAGAIPYTLLLRAVLPEIIPHAILRDPFLFRLVNLIALALALFGSAFVFRDRPPNVEVTPKPPDGPLPPEASS